MPLLVVEQILLTAQAMSGALTFLKDSVRSSARSSSSATFMPLSHFWASSRTLFKASDPQVEGEEGQHRCTCFTCKDCPRKEGQKQRPSGDGGPSGVKPRIHKLNDKQSVPSAPSDSALLVALHLVRPLA